MSTNILPECPICLNELKTKYTTLCKHEFHLQCLVDWLRNSQTCPICRTEIKYARLRIIDKYEIIVYAYA